MENAAKALLIAGGVFLAMMVLSVWTYLSQNFRNTSEQYVQQLDAIELQKYNSNFEIYIGRKNLTAQDIVTVASAAKQLEQGTQIFVTIGAITKEVTTGSQKDFEIWKSEFLSKYILTDIEGQPEPINVFECLNEQYNTDGKISQLTFKKIR